MDLILWRHAEAEPGEPDAGRMLTAKGRRQAAKVGAWLDRNLPAECRILCSPAARCVQTAEALGRPFRIVEGLAPGATPAEILGPAGWPEARDPVVVVGHQPTLGQLAALLLSGTAQAWAIRKANAWWLSNRVKEDGANVVLRAVAGPDLL